MNQGQLVFAQLMQHLPLTTFRRCVTRYQGERKIKSFSCLDQFLCMAFAQLTYRESLRDIEACLRAQQSKLYHLGIRSAVARNTLADANAVRDWRIYADFAQSLIGIARPLYDDEPFGVDLKQSVYALDSTTIDLCLSLFSWAPFRSTKAAVKVHTLLDLRGNIPTFIHITDGDIHDLNILDQSLPEPGAIYVMDRGFLTSSVCTAFTKPAASSSPAASPISRSSGATRIPSTAATGLICDQTVVLTGFYSHKGFEAPLRRIRFKDPETEKTLIFLTNNFGLSALTITELYRCRSQVELFFKWIKQHLRIKAFFGTSENAVKSQAPGSRCRSTSSSLSSRSVSSSLPASTRSYRILSLTMFERMPVDQLLAQAVTDDIERISDKQLILFE